MVNDSSKPAERQSPADAQDEPDRRKHMRVHHPFKARFLVEGGQEQPCLVLNISVGGALFRADNPPEFGKQVILYLDELGRFEGQVIRSDAKRFAVNFNAKRAKKTRIADDLTEILNKGRKSRNRRVSPRIKQDAPAVVFFEDGSNVKCAILDISLTGASIQIDPRPSLGTRLILGRMTAKVVRRHDKGVGVIFTGTAEKIADVVEQASATDAPPKTGATIARTFGKKGARA